MINMILSRNDSCGSVSTWFFSFGSMVIATFDWIAHDQDKSFYYQLQSVCSCLFHVLKRTNSLKILVKKFKQKIILKNSI